MSDRTGAFSPSRPSAAQSTSDETLMRRLAQGEVAALDELLDRHWEPVLDFAVRTVRCGDSAQDLAQQAFIDLWEGRGSWDPGSHPRPLLLRMVRNRALNEERRYKVRDRAADQVRRLETARRSAGPAQDLAAREVETAFKDALDSLPPRRREVFTLSRFQGLSYAEIGEVLGTSPQTVANQMSAALKTLRRALTDVHTPQSDVAD
jgi:RNA polymerase sigma-70 factor, ECF subfamily